MGQIPMLAPCGRVRAVATDADADPRALIEAYYDAGYTDGLPVVPPTDA